MPKEKLNGTAVIINFSKKEMSRMRNGEITHYVTRTFERLLNKYPQLRFTGKWDLHDRSLKFFCERKEEV